MTEPEKMTRRKYISTVGGAVVGAAAGVAAGYFMGVSQAPTANPLTVTETATVTAAPATSAVSTSTGTSTAADVLHYPTTDLVKAISSASNIDWKQLSGEQITFLQFDWTGVDDKVLLAGEFERLSGIKVTFERLPVQDLDTKAQLAFAAQSAPFDCLSTHEPPLFISMNGLEPLEPYLTDSKLTDQKWFDWNDHYPGSIIMGQSELEPGVQYCVPNTVEPDVIMYRKDLYEKWGAPIPQGHDSLSLDELMTAAKLTNHPDQGYSGYATRTVKEWSHAAWAWIPILLDYGGAVLNKDFTPAWNSAEGVQAAEYWRDILKKYGPPGINNWSHPDQNLAMINGTLAAEFDVYMYGMWANDPASGGKPELQGKYWFMMPAKGPHGMNTGTWTWTQGINKNTTDNKKKASWLWLEFLNSKEVETNYAYKWNYDTARNSVWTNPLIQQRWGQNENNMFDTLVAVNQVATPDAHQRRIPEWYEIGNDLGEHLQNILATNADPKAELDAAAKAAEDVLRKAGRIP